jgi:ADP-ribose pyrophosphatase YjhB (NUDIX family)
MRGGGPRLPPGGASRYQQGMPWPVLAVSVLIRDGDKVLLVRRAAPPSTHRWAFPGGKVEPGERLDAAAAREVMEETGIVVTDLKQLDVAEVIDNNPDGTVRTHHVIVVFEGRPATRRPTPGSDAGEARWVRVDAAAGLGLTADTARILAGLNPPAASGRDRSDVVE